MKERGEIRSNCTVDLTFDRDMDPIEVVDLSLDLTHLYNRLILHSENREDEIEVYIETGEVNISDEKKLRIDFSNLYQNNVGKIMKGSKYTFKIPSAVDQSVVSDFAQICEAASFVKNANPLKRSK